jgi:hypothetical protein
MGIETLDSLVCPSGPVQRGTVRYLASAQAQTMTPSGRVVSPGSLIWTRVWYNERRYGQKREAG